MSLLNSPWQLRGFARPHHAIPLGNGWWRGPTPGPGQIAELKELGLEIRHRLDDGSSAFFPGPHFFDGHSQPLSPQEIEAAEIGAATWIAARIQLGISAVRKAADPCRWMAILNLTPDSFSDGGNLLQAGPDSTAFSTANEVSVDNKACPSNPADGVAAGSKACPADLRIAHSALIQTAEQAATQGASWLDLGAESTRPGAEPIPPHIQLGRLLPAIKALHPIGIPISIDTRSPEVAAACLSAGASMINDISGLGDLRLAEVCAQASCPTVLMHMRGTPATMQDHCQYDHLLGQVADELAVSAARGLDAGLNGEKIFLDPGIGFSKTAQQNLELLANVGSLRALGFPLLVGPSRKSFLAPLIPGKEAADRDCGSAGAAASCAMQGVAILRLHQGTYWDAIQVSAQIGAARSKDPGRSSSLPDPRL